MFIQDEADDHRRRRFTRRAVVLGLGQAAGLAALTGRLYQLQILDQNRYLPLADKNRLNLRILAPTRGRILDRFGRVLASNQDSFQAVLIRSLSSDLPKVLKRLSEIVPLSEEQQLQIIHRARKQSPNRAVIAVRDLTWEQFAQINLQAPQLPGIQGEVRGRRQYAYGRDVGHIVGYVGLVERFALDDDPVLRIPWIRTGKTGVERANEKRLRGQGGFLKYEVDARGRIIRNIEKRAPQPGRDTVITIDMAVQRRVMDRLLRERRAALVALDVASGEVVTMASAPSYDPQEIVGGIKADKWRKIRAAEDQPMMNRAIRGQYPPASTFKMVTALAALEAGVITLDEEINCNGRYELAGQVFRCWKRRGHGNVDLQKALRSSCDVYFYELANRLGIKALAAMARRLGFGRTYSAGIALQKPGLVPDPDWKFGRFNKSWYAGETVLAGIGQGFVLATPLQMAVMTARIASGRAVEPRLLRPDAGDVRQPFAKLDIKEEWLNAVREGMYGVVNEPGGTGHKAQLAGSEQTVAGKTGTSQISRRSAERDQEVLSWKERDHALFVGYVPYEAPRYAVAAVVEHGGGGGATAAPLVSDVMDILLQEDPMAKPALEGPPPETASVVVDSPVALGEGQ